MNMPSSLSKLIVSQCICCFSKACFINVSSHIKQLFLLQLIINRLRLSALMRNFPSLRYNTWVKARSSEPMSSQNHVCVRATVQRRSSMALSSVYLSQSIRNPFGSYGSALFRIKEWLIKLAICLLSQSFLNSLQFVCWYAVKLMRCQTSDRLAHTKGHVLTSRLIHLCWKLIMRNVSDLV